jgi:DNA-binding transcriptional regulator GbsR (MarR family)
MKNIHPFQKSFLDLAGEIAESISFNRSIGQLFAFLYLSPQPLSLEDIAESCQMSKGNASVHLRTLEAWGAVRCSWKQGTRKDYYTANANLMGLIIKRFQEGINKRVDHVHQRLRVLKDDPSFSECLRHPEGAHWKKRFEEIETLVSKIEKTLPAIYKLAEIGKFLGRS